MHFSKNIRDIKRISQIVNVLVKNGLGYVVQELGLKYHLPLIKRFSKYSEPVSLPERMKDVFEELGGSFVKLGQLLSLRPDLVPVEFCKEFRKLQDDVKPFGVDTAKKTIAEELGKKPSEVFSTFDEHPMGSASIAQVHKASLKNKKLVVVKVKRPNIAEIFDSDIDIMYYFADKLEKHKLNKGFSPRTIVQEFEKYTKKELNFTYEARNIVLFYEKFKKSRYVKIPRVYTDLSTPNILVLEYIEGEKLSGIKKKKHRKKYDRKRIAINLTHTCVSQVFDTDVFHADMHPGNILVLPDHRIALLDFGIIGSLSDELRRKGIKLLKSLLSKDIDGVYNALLGIGYPSPDTDMIRFKMDVTDIVNEWYGTELRQVKVTSMLHRLFDSCVKHDITMPVDMILLAKALVTVEGTCLWLDPKFNFTKVVKPKVDRIIRDKKLGMFSTHKVVDKTNDIAEFIRDFSNQALGLIKTVKKGSFRVDIDDTDIRSLGKDIDSSSNRLAFGMIIAALIVSGALIVQTDAEPFIFGLPILSTISFVAALFLAGILVASIFKEGKYEKIFRH